MPPLVAGDDQLAHLVAQLGVDRGRRARAVGVRASSRVASASTSSGGSPRALQPSAFASSIWRTSAAWIAGSTGARPAPPRLGGRLLLDRERALADRVCQALPERREE